MDHIKLLEDRLDFLQFDDDAVELLNLRKQIEPAVDDLLDRFYAHILGYPEIKALFVDDESVARARAAQKRHWLEALFSADFDPLEIDLAVQIGKVHERVGLTPGLYMGAYCFMLNGFISVIADAHDGDVGDLVRKIQALNKTVFLDMTFVVDSYLEAKDTAITNLLLRATQFTDDVRTLGTELDQTARDLRDRAGRDPDRLEGSYRTDILDGIAELSTQIGNLQARLDQLQHGDKLFVADEQRGDLLARIKAFMAGRW